MTIHYTVDGVDLHDPDGRWDVLSSSSVSTAITVNGTDLTVPGVSGSLPNPGAPLSSPQLAINLCVSGADVDEMLANYQALASLLRNGSSILRTVGSTLQRADMELQTLSAPVFFQSLNRFETTAVVKLPSVWWRGPSADWSQDGVTSGTSYTVSTLTGSTAPVVDALVLLRGPVSSPKVTCGNAWYALDLTIPSGLHVLVDCAKWTVTYGYSVGLDFDERDGDDKSGSLTTSGGPYLFPLQPVMQNSDPADTVVKLSMTGTSMASNTQIQIRARPAYPA